MLTNPRTTHFDHLAAIWDTLEDQVKLAETLHQHLSHFSIGSSEVIVDVGCGTGNLSAALLGWLSTTGRIAGIDISPAMVEAARSKISDSRATFCVGSAEKLPIGAWTANRVFFFNLWPHLDAPEAAAREALRVLVTGGHLHVWHLLPRVQVNAIHARSDSAIRGDLLPPAPQVAEVLSRAGFRVVQLLDADEYIVTAVKAATE